MITKEKFIAAISQMGEEYFHIYLVRKNKILPQRKYIYGNFKALCQEQPNKSKEEVLFLMKEKMWEVALKEIKPQTVENYFILKIYSTLEISSPVSLTEE